jgi:nitrogen fixation protein FixH
MTTADTQITGSTPPAPRSRRWAYIFIGLLTVHAGATIAMVVVATSDPSFAVEPDYYEQALNWDAAAAQTVHNEQLNWSVRVETEAAGPETRGRMLFVHLLDAEGRALDGASVTVEWFHHARSAERTTGELPPASAGRYAGILPLDRPGMWEVRLIIRRGPETFTKRTHIEIPGIDGGGR